MWDSIYADHGHLDDPHLWERARLLDLDLSRFDDRPAQRRGRRRACGQISRAESAPGWPRTPTAFADGERISATWFSASPDCGMCNIARVREREFYEKWPPSGRFERKSKYMSMFDVRRVSAEIGGNEISFETGKLARQAGGAVVVRAGDTMVLCTATMGNLRDVDFLPLTVDVEEKHYAAGKVPGSFFRREARAGEKATLTARMIDRPVRPLFPKGWHFETQLVAQPMSVDHVHPYDILAMNGASAALAISPIPVAKYVGAVRIGKLDGDFVVNPEEEALEELEMDLIVSGSDEAILMVECGADGVTEAEVLDALDIAHGEIKTLIGAMEELREKAGKEKVEVEEPEVDEAVLEQIRSKYGAKLDEATQVPEKLARQDAIDAVEELALAELAAGDGDVEVDPEKAPEVARAFAKLEKDIIRRRIAVDKKRPDGRAQDEIRPIETEVDVAPRVHGSALFTRGETQILSAVALGTTRMDMKVDNLGLQETKRFWHHYNFPPFSVGEAGFMRGPKRRDIGHGALAERALAPTIPDEEEFPYVIRVVSDTLESNGSSSMGSVCASSMALQAAGVPGPHGGRRRRDGPDQGGRRLRRAHRHRRRRGPPRRHGLQGRRLRGRDHRPADGHQDHRRHLRDPHRRARAGAQGPPVHPRQDGRGDRRTAREALRVRARDRVDQDRPREDRGRHRQGRRDDPRHAGGVRGRDRHRRRRHRPRLRAERRAGRGRASSGSSR